MKRMNMVTNSTAVNRYGIMFLPHALECGMKQCWQTGVPSSISHDQHRLVGWTLPLALHLRPGLGRLTAALLVPESHDEEQALHAAFAAHTVRRVDELVMPHRPELEKRLSHVLGGNEQPLYIGCASLGGPGLARRAWQDIFASADKDGLVPLRQLNPIHAGVYENDGLLFFAHQYFRRSLSRFNTLNTCFLADFEELAKDEALDLRIALDPDVVGLASTFKPAIELEYWWGPKFSNDLPAISLGVTQHRTDEREALFHGISRTEYWWYEQGDRRTFECEEVRDLPTLGAGSDRFGCRFVHSILEQSSGKPCHMDGAIRMYSESTMIERLDVDLKKAGRRTDYTKLWRVDGVISVRQWKQLLCDYFRDNREVGEYLGGVEDGPQLNREMEEEDSPPSPIFSYIPTDMSAADGVQIALSYHPKTSGPFAGRLICSFDFLTSGSTRYQYIEGDVVELVKALKREGASTDFMPDLVKVTFEDSVLNLPLIMHSGPSAVTLANQTQQAISLICERSVQLAHDRLVSYTLGVDYADRACFYSFAGHVEALHAWLRLPAAVLPELGDDIGQWATSAHFALSRTFPARRDGPPIWNILEHSGVLAFKRKILKPGEFVLKFENGKPEVLLQVPKEDLELIRTAGMTTSSIWKIKRSRCTSCGREYQTCPCSKLFDSGPVEEIEDAEVLGIFWTNRPA